MLYIKRGPDVFIHAEGEFTSKRLEPRVFNITYDRMLGYYLTESTALKLTMAKMYGSAKADAQRVVQTFLSRQKEGKNTGVLLSGTKGSGKTLLSKVIADKLVTEYKLPVIVVSTPLEDSSTVEQFMTFLQNIDTPCMVMFDEYEKVIHKEVQERLLTLYDGVIGGNKLFVFTVNSVDDVDSHMMNRPGRVFYHFEFSGLDDDVIRQYLTDSLVNKDNIESAADYIKTRFKNAFTYDMLSSLIEEMNRFDETCEEALKYLNINVYMQRFDITFFDKDGVEVGRRRDVADLDEVDFWDSKSGNHYNFIRDDFQMYDYTKECHVFKNEHGAFDARPTNSSRSLRLLA